MERRVVAAGAGEDSFARLRRLVRICDRYEVARAAGHPLAILDLLREVPEPERPELARRLDSLTQADRFASLPADSRPDDETLGPSPVGQEVRLGREPSDDLCETLDLDSHASILSMDTTRELPAPVRVLGPFDQLRPGSIFGDYEILQRVGRGGMGVVYRARQRKSMLDRVVALKLIRADRVADPLLGSSIEMINRFRIETQAAASLEHPHVVPVYDAGERDGRLYYSMLFVEGEGLDKLLLAGPVTGRRAAEILEPIARAVQAAHDRGIIHRDIKPSNILIDPSGKPYLSDFGLAKLVGEADGITMTQAQLGSPPYMSPEQVRDSARVGPPSDIYNLGATLYRLIAGRPPFQAAENLETMRQVVDELPVPPRRLNPAISKDLETLSLKCLEKEPDRRFRSAGELADELRRHLDDVPILTRPNSAWDRAIRWFRRRPAIAAMLVAILLVATIGVAGILWGIHRTNQARDALETGNRRLQETNRSLGVRGYYDRIALAGELIAAHRLNQAEDVLTQCPGPLRGWEWRHLKRRCLEEPSAWRALPDVVYGVAFRPDGVEVACGGRGGVISLWDARTRRSTGELRGVPVGATVLRVAWGRTEAGFDRIIAACSDGRLRIWDRAAGTWGTSREIRAHSGSANDVAIGPDQRVVSSGADGRIAVWDGDSGERLATLQESGPSVQAIALGPGGLQLASAGDDHSVRLWDLSRPHSSRVLGELTDHGHGVAFSRDGRRVAAADADGILRIWDLQAGGECRTIKAHPDGINGIAFSPDGGRLASAGADGHVRLWDTVEGVEALTFRDQAREGALAVEIEGLAFSPDGDRLAAAGSDGRVELYESTPGNRVAPPRPIELSGHEEVVVALAVRPDGDQVASGSVDGEIRLWPVSGSLPPRTLLGHRDRVNALAYSPDGRRLVSAGRDREIRLWEPEGGGGSKVLGTCEGKVVALAFLPDGRHVASGGDERTIRIWDASGVEPPRTLGAVEVEVYALAVSPDGGRLASAGAGRSITLWDLSGLEPPRFLSGHSRQVNGLAFGRSGRLLYSVSHDRTGRVWDLQGGPTCPPLEGHVGRVWGVAAAPDGRHLATAGSDGLVRIWDGTTGREVARLAGHEGRVYAVAFDPRGRFLASAGRDARIRLWDPARWAEPLDDASPETGGPAP